MRRGVRLPLEALSPVLVDVDPAAEVSPLGDWKALFGNDHPVEIEVGFGKGLFLLTAGSQRPGTNFLGIEIERKYTLYTANRLAKRQLANVRVCSGDARQIFERFVPESSVQGLHIFFPDPWWKNRHRKRRLFTDAFAQSCVRCLKVGGTLHIVSDVALYFAEITELLGRQERLQPVPPPSPAEPRHEFDFLTNFERKYRQEGRPIHRGSYSKSASAKDFV
jgi:tRNA (guanine-N7-)-methyltransferase